MNGSNFAHMLMNVLLLVVGFFGGVVYNKYYNINNVVNYSSCVAAGYEILNTFPPQCKTPNGRIFVDEANVNNTLPAQDDTDVITDFEKCIARGFPIKGRDPRYCVTGDGKTFIEERSTDELNVGGTINPSTIDSFEKCIAAGYEVISGIPRKCTTPDGATFIEGLSPVDSPQPPSSP